MKEKQRDLRTEFLLYLARNLHKGDEYLEIPRRVYFNINNTRSFSDQKLRINNSGRGALKEDYVIKKLGRVRETLSRKYNYDFFARYDKNREFWERGGIKIDSYLSDITNRVMKEEVYGSILITSIEEIIKKLENGQEVC